MERVLPTNVLVEEVAFGGRTKKSEKGRLWHDEETVDRTAAQPHFENAVLMAVTDRLKQRRVDGYVLNVELEMHVDNSVIESEIAVDRLVNRSKRATRYRWCP